MRAIVETHPDRPHQFPDSLEEWSKHLKFSILSYGAYFGGLRPGGLHVYTVRHTEDAHYRAGIPHGDNMFECGRFIVHFFDEALVQRLATGFSVLDWTAFEEGALPRRLWRVTLRRDPDNK